MFQIDIWYNVSNWHTEIMSCINFNMICRCLRIVTNFVFVYLESKLRLIMGWTTLRLMVCCISPRLLYFMEQNLRRVIHIWFLNICGKENKPKHNLYPNRMQDSIMNFPTSKLPGMHWLLSCFELNWCR